MKFFFSHKSPLFFFHTNETFLMFDDFEWYRSRTNIYPVVDVSQRRCERASGMGVRERCGWVLLSADSWPSLACLFNHFTMFTSLCFYLFIVLFVRWLCWLSRLSVGPRRPTRTATSQLGEWVRILYIHSFSAAFTLSSSPFTFPPVLSHSSSLIGCPLPFSLLSSLSLVIHFSSLRPPNLSYSFSPSFFSLHWSHRHFSLLHHSCFFLSFFFFPNIF